MVVVGVVHSHAYHPGDSLKAGFFGAWVESSGMIMLLLILVEPQNTILVTPKRLKKDSLGFVYPETQKKSEDHDN